MMNAAIFIFIVLFINKIIFPSFLLSELIYAITALIIVYYTIETALIRKYNSTIADANVKALQQLEYQNSALRKQNFESTFFQMLSLHHEIVNTIKIRGKDDEGRGNFRYMCEALVNLYRWDLLMKDGDELKPLNILFEEFYASYQVAVGHYFRNLYNIIKYIDNSEIPNKKFYTNLVRAQLSSYELTLLFYNCLSVYGSEKFKPYVERYALLKNMQEGTLIKIDHKTFYDQSAFVQT